MGQFFLHIPHVIAYESLRSDEDGFEIYGSLT